MQPPAPGAADAILAGVLVVENVDRHDATGPGCPDQCGIVS